MKEKAPLLTMEIREHLEKYLKMKNAHSQACQQWTTSRIVPGLITVVLLVAIQPAIIQMICTRRRI
jgi:hypothetical protein